jgi:hypothetical protein
MASNQVKTICRNAEKLKELIQPGMQLDAWIQSKLAIVEDHITTITNYIENEQDAPEVLEPQVVDAPDMEAPIDVEMGDDSEIEMGMPGEEGEEIDLDAEIEGPEGEVDIEADDIEDMEDDDEDFSEDGMMMDLLGGDDEEDTGGFEKEEDEDDDEEDINDSAEGSKKPGKSFKMKIKKRVNENYMDRANIHIKNIIDEYGTNPSDDDVVGYCWDNYEEITGFDDEDKYEEMHFPDEILEITQRFGIDYDTLSYEWGMYT